MTDADCTGGVANPAESLGRSAVRLAKLAEMNAPGALVLNELSITVRRAISYVQCQEAERLRKQIEAGRKKVTTTKGRKK